MGEVDVEIRGHGVVVCAGGKGLLRGRMLCGAVGGTSALPEQEKHGMAEE